MTQHDLSRAVWRKSAYSGGATNCVEVAGNLPAIVAVRDSKDPAGPSLTFGRHAWDVFTGQVKSGGYGKSGKRLEASGRRGSGGPDLLRAGPVAREYGGQGGDEAG